jgi:hypothetical protein
MGEHSVEHIHPAAAQMRDGGVEIARQGGCDRLFPYDDPADSDGLRAATAPFGDVQAVERFAVGRQGARHRRALSVAAQPRLVFSVNEESQNEALDREQPVLPMMPGVPERRTHSYATARNRCSPHSISPSALDFFKQIETQVRRDLDVWSR